MPPYHLPSTSRALYRVFIAPQLSRTPFLPTSTQSPLALPRPSGPLTPIRTKFYKKDTRRHALSDTYTLDAAITSPLINFIDASGHFHSSIPTKSVQSSINQTTHHLLLLNAGRLDSSGHPDPSHLPTCKVISKIDLRAQHQKKLDIERKKSKTAAGGQGVKNLELNWAIAEGDLKHRLGKMREFLREGRKVEVLFGPKRRGRVASDRECKEVLERVREAVGECKGAGVVKEEGRVGGVLTMVVEGRKVEDKKVEGKEKEMREREVEA